MSLSFLIILASLPNKQWAQGISIASYKHFHTNTIHRIFSRRGNFFFIAGETMWLIDHSEGEGVGGGCAPSHAAYSAKTYCLILFLTVRFTLWTNKGNAIMSATGTAT